MVKNSGIFNSDNNVKYYVLILVILIIVSLCYSLIVYHFTKFEKVITIYEKYTRYRRKGSNYNLIDTDGNIYQIDNLWFKFDYNRADDYAKLKEGKQYKVKGYGFRAGFLESYQKIYEVESV
jgi:hypothetical protein